jgi:hypothetical protein
MGEFLFELLLVFAELFLEIFLEVAATTLFDLALRAIAKVFDTLRFANPVVASIGYTLLGTLAGGLSVFIVPHPLVHPSRLHGINLLVSPIVTGFVMSLFGSVLRRQGGKVTRIESFGYGFVFAFGMALIRYLFVI